MNEFHLGSDGPAGPLTLALAGEITIEQARALASALREAALRGRPLRVQADRLTRLDAAALQILLAAARLATSAAVVDPAPAWAAAFQRYALADPFTHTTSCPKP